MKILGVVYQSQTEKARLALFQDLVDDLTSGLVKAKALIEAEQGNLEWVPIITQLREFKAPMSDVMPVVEEIKVNDLKEGKTTSSWIMKTIINNKDKKLFTAAGKYLSEPEKQYCKELLK